MIRIALILLMSLAVSSQAVAAVKWNNPVTAQSSKYKTFEGLPCNFYGAEIGAINRNSSLGSNRNRCKPKHKGYRGKKGMTIYAKRGTPVVAPTDIKLVSIKDASAEMNCLVMNDSQKKLGMAPSNSKNCQQPFDDLHVTFEDDFGNQFYFYHLMQNNPMVPGYGKGKCKTPKLYETEKFKRKAENCGGIQKSYFKKGEVIGYVGTTGHKKAYRKGQHISFAVWVNSHPSFSGKKKGWVVPSNSLKWENIPSDDPLIYLFPIKRPD